MATTSLGIRKIEENEGDKVQAVNDALDDTDGLLVDIKDGTGITVDDPTNSNAPTILQTVLTNLWAPFVAATAFGKSLLTQANAAALLTTLSLGNVDNTSDANKPVSTATQTALNLKADLVSPAFTNTPTAPTAAVGTNTAQLATMAAILAALANLQGNSSTWAPVFKVVQSTTGPGTVSNSAGGTTVTGVNTTFTSTFKPGDTVTIGGQTVAISAIASDTSMTTAAITLANANSAYTLVGGVRWTVNGNGRHTVNGVAVQSAAVTIPATVGGDDPLILRDTTSGANARFYFTTPLGSAPDLNINSGRLIVIGRLRLAGGVTELTGAHTWNGGATIQTFQGQTVRLQSDSAGTYVFVGGTSQDTVVRPYSSSYKVLIDGTFSANSALYLGKQRAVTTSTTIGSDDHALYYDTSSGNITQTLPNATGQDARVLQFCKATSDANTLTISPTAGQGTATTLTTTDAIVRYQAYNGVWRRISIVN